MIDFIDLIFNISLFIFGLVAIALIPSKDMIEKKMVKSFSLEKHVAIYIIAFVLLLIGFFLLMAFFSEDVENQILYMTNAIFLEAIALGIMGLNYRNYHVFTETSGPDQMEQRIEVAEVQAISDTDYQYQSTTKSIPGANSNADPRVSNAKQHTPSTQSTQMVECPQCNAAINVDTSNRPVKLSCPRCGIEGMVQ